MFGDEPYGNYNRILLSNVLNGTQDAKEIFLNPLAWYEENGVTPARRQARHAHRPRGADASTPRRRRGALRHLVFATGCKPFVPPIPGARRGTAAGVFVFRTLDDCRRSPSYAKGCKTAAVIGGGLLGLEAAKGLMTHDVEVTSSTDAPR